MSSSFWQSKFNQSSLYVSAFLNILTWALLVWKIVLPGGSVILHYTVYLGVDIYDDAGYAILIPLVALVFLIINTILSILISKNDREIAQIIMGVTVLIQIFALVAGTIITLVNT